MFRATVETDGGRSVVSVAGRLTRDFVEEVERACLSAAPPVVLDAEELRSCDPDGLALLARIQDSDVKVEGLSGYLAMSVCLYATRGSGETDC